ncbi:hypothetical protein BRM9_1669 [Methanobacterium formicicum]|uniref:Uncharacterized protein n=1 Tax=Methanobacterium formicicum TaxID=2162 RepID=A0A089ZCG6_METFO|nr:hypothetical protein [Methanobacterium formicicum]AIS32481.1 hypothetical protein BRM9_1669 [Methanobacterium formicicum]
MSIEFSFQPKNLDEILILDIRTRVDIAIKRVKDNRSVSKIDIEVLKMDKTTLNQCTVPRTSPGMSKIASNLINKIDYILKKNEEE